jgi:uncharacterized protein
LSYAPAIDFAALLNALKRPDAFPFALPRDTEISLVQTHASAVLLTPNYVYKLKKPMNFGFFDYSTPARRRHFCGQEVLLNTRLAPQIYLGVAPILAFAPQTIRFGPTLEPASVPEPGSMFDGGEVIDYAVVMVRLPDEATLEAHIHAGSATPALLAEVARVVAAFHENARIDEHIASSGGLDVIRGNWEENFAQMKPYIGRCISAAAYERIATYIRRFMDARAALFAERIRSGRIRDCHGDLRLQHVYFLAQVKVPDHPLPPLAVLDCIEFNERFRYSDVAAEIAFLTMEMDACGRSDLAQAFIASYVAATDDAALRELLPFYACYRACVRGKVSSFQLDEPEIPELQRERVRQEASMLFDLAASYASGPTTPTVLKVGGLMGTGKSTLARALQRQLGWALFSSDTTRKRLAGLEPGQPSADEFGKGLYSAEWTARTYAALRDEVASALSTGRSVLLDASFLQRASRQRLAQIAVEHGAQVIFVECTCPRDVVLQRLARRWEQRVQGKRASFTGIAQASDGRPELYDKQRANWEDLDASEKSVMQHYSLKTTLQLAVNVEQVLDCLQISRLACFMNASERL